MGLTSEYLEDQALESTDGRAVTDPSRGGLFRFLRPAYPDEVTALQDRTTIALADLKTRLGVGVSTYDDTLTRLLGMAEREADDYLRNWFTEYQVKGGTQVTIPENVIQGIVAFVAAEWFAQEPELAGLFVRVVRLGSLTPAGVASESKRDVRISYRGGGSESGAAGTVLDDSLPPGKRAALRYWADSDERMPPPLA